MKNACFVAVLLAVAVLAGGCDQFRRLAGRPTSEDIAVKKARIEADEAAHQARLDSLRKVQKAMADSLELIDRIKASRTMILSAANVRGLSAAGLSNRYYVVVGTFGSLPNAKAQREKAMTAGYDAVLIPFNNGFTAVGLGGSDTLAGIWETLGIVREQPFCPKDVWVLVNE